MRRSLGGSRDVLLRRREVKKGLCKVLWIFFLCIFADDESWWLWELIKWFSLHVVFFCLLV